MKISFDVNYRDLSQAIGVRAVAQAPFALALTLTRLAKDSKDGIVTKLPTVFDRPTAFTLNSVASTTASKSDPKATVFFKESQAQAGRAKNEHVRPGLLGASARSQKKTEYLLSRMGELPAGWVTVPGPSMPKDGFGNMPGAIYKQIVNGLQLKANTQRGARPVFKASQKRAAKLGVSAEFFSVAPGKNTIAKGGGWLPPGVYRHLPGRKLVQMLKFVRKARYIQRLDVAKTVRETVATQLPKRWAEAVAQTIATAVKVK